jgi:hypothetical protein
MFRKIIIVLAVWAFLCIGPGSVKAAAVDVFADGAYTTTDLVVEIYANITPAILSYGVKLVYDPGQLTVTRAEKNEAVWYLGDGTTAGNKAYMSPVTSTPGEVVIIGGKLDTANPTAGVTGQRVLLGKIFFSRTGSSMPFVPVLNLTYGRDPLTGYANFVATDGSILDTSEVTFIMKVVERGDTNANGRITIADVNAVKSVIGSTIFPVYMDCNADGRITIADVNCVKSRIK